MTPIQPNQQIALRAGENEFAILAKDSAEYFIVENRVKSGRDASLPDEAQRSGDSDYSGELYALYVLPGQQRKGVGRRLVEAVTERLVQSGHDSMSVWVLEQNPARGFYVALGGRQLGTKDVQIGTQTLVEVAYGWSDIRRES